jgi:hypothetical protein
VGFKLVVKVVVKYEHEIFMPLLLFVYNTLILVSIIVESIQSITLELGVFRLLTYTKNVTLEPFKFELSLLRNTIMLANAFSPFTWWIEYEQLFLNI